MVLSLHLAILVLSSFHISNAAECNGCVILDSKTFDKVLSKFDLMIVKFDKYNPDLKKHAAFGQVYADLSKEVGMENMMAAHVNIIKDGEIKNTELVNEYQLQTEIFEESLPAVFAFMKIKEGEKKGDNETHSYSMLTKSDFDADSLKRAIRSYTGIYFTLPGCIDNFDFLAVKFAGEATTFKQKSVISEAEVHLSQIPQAETEKVAIAKEYISWMKKIVDSGKDIHSFTEDTFEELKKSELEKEKQNQAMNILDAFSLGGRFQMVEAPEHDEL